MEETIKQDKSASHKEFEKLLSKDLDNRKFKEGEITTAVVSQVGKKFKFVDLGLKSEGAIPIEEFKISKEITKIEIGSKIDVLLEKIGFNLLFPIKNFLCTGSFILSTATNDS